MPQPGGADKAMDWTEDIIKRLTLFAAEQQLVEKAEEGWRAWFANTDGVIDGWRVEELSSQFRSHMLCFKSGLLDYPYITTSVDLFGPTGSEVAQYRLITMLNGEVNDDYLEITDHPSKD
jgi:hypothetical protein